MEIEATLALNARHGSPYTARNMRTPKGGGALPIGFSQGEEEEEQGGHGEEEGLEEEEW